TNRDLKAWSAQGKFRQDLYYRLSVFTIPLPALRERGDDLPMLVQHYLRRFSRELGRQVREITPEALELLRSYPWPGNIRELQGVLKQAILQATGTVLIPLKLRPNEGGNSVQKNGSGRAGQKRRETPWDPTSTTGRRCCASARDPRSFCYDSQPRPPCWQCLFRPRRPPRAARAVRHALLARQYPRRAPPVLPPGCCRPFASAFLPRQSPRRPPPVRRRGRRGHPCRPPAPRQRHPLPAPAALPGRRRLPGGAGGQPPGRRARPGHLGLHP